MLNARRKQGFSLIEVLIAVLVLSIGLLGLASLQTLSLKRGNSAAQRVEAINFAYDLLDRMRANRGQAIAGRYNVASGDVPAANSDLANIDVRAWKAAIAAALPAGDGSVLVEDQVVTIQVNWAETVDAQGGGGVTAEVNLRTQI